MPQTLLTLDRERAELAAKNCAALVAGYALALWLDWKASSVATTIIVLQTAALGTTLNKAAMRMAGTAAGAVLGLITVACFADDRELFVVAMAAITGGCVWAMQKSSHVYAWLLVLLTSAIVGWPAASNALNTFHTSVDRITAVTVGVILSTIANGVLWPKTAGGQFEAEMRGVLIGCRELMQMAAKAPLDDAQKAALAGKQSEVMRLASALPTTLDSARADSKPHAKHFDRYQQVVDGLRGAGVEIACGFVRHYASGLSHHRPGHGGPLAFTS